MKKDLVFYNSAQAIWKNIANHTSIGLITKRDQLQSLHHAVFKIGECYFFTFDISSGEFNAVSEEIETIHPDDQPYFLKFESELDTFYKALPNNHIDQYKVQYDFRIADANGNWKRILHQMLIIEFDDNNNLITSLGIHTDISHIKQHGHPTMSFIGSNGLPSFYNFCDDATIGIKPLFTKRELDVLKLMILGKTSALISEELFVSIHTINTHRKNILKKSRCETVNELLVMAISEHWI